MKIMDKLVRDIKRLVQAEIDATWAGARDPDDYDDIMAEQKLARSQIERTLKFVEAAIEEGRLK